MSNQGNLPQVYYGRHFEPGVALYKQGAKEMMAFIGEECAKKMDPTMAGKPIVVEHINGPLPDTSDGIKQMADGFVSESFYNPADGAHWARFVAVTDSAKQKINSGWKLSNAYKATEMGAGGKWHAVPYDQEILDGEYEHLALVQNPRYESSIILTPEQFKTYCAEKKTEIARLANSAEDKPKQQGAKSVLSIFKRTRVENSADFDEMMVRLPKSGRELTLTTLVNEMDKFCNGEGYANPDHMVKVGNEEMSVKEMADCYGKMKNEKMEEESKKKNAEDDEKKRRENMTDEERAEEDKKKKNGDISVSQGSGKSSMIDRESMDRERAKAEEYAAMERKMNSEEYRRFKNKVDEPKDGGTIRLRNDDTTIVLAGTGVKKGLAAYGGPVSSNK